MYLASQSVVLVLTCERFTFEPGEDYSDVLRGLGEHRFAWNTRRQMAILVHVASVPLGFLQSLNNQSVVWELMAALPQSELPFLWSRLIFRVLVKFIIASS